MWATTAASYCPSRAGELPKQNLMKPHEQWDGKLCKVCDEISKLDVDPNSGINLCRRMDLDEGQLRSEKRRIMKNVVVISFAFLLLFTAFQSMAALQSSINKVGKTWINGGKFKFTPP